MTSPVFFLQVCLLCAADFQFCTFSTDNAAFCTLPSHLVRGFPTGLFPPKLPPQNLRLTLIVFCPYRDQPAWDSLFEYILKGIYPHTRHVSLRCVWFSMVLVNGWFQISFRGFFVQRNRFCSRLILEQSVFPYHIPGYYKWEFHIKLVTPTLQLMSR